MSPQRRTQQDRAQGNWELVLAASSRQTVVAVLQVRSLEIGLVVSWREVWKKKLANPQKQKREHGYQ